MQTTSMAPITQRIVERALKLGSFHYHKIRTALPGTNHTTISVILTFLSRAGLLDTKLKPGPLTHRPVNYYTVSDKWKQSSDMVAAALHAIKTINTTHHKPLVVASKHTNTPVVAKSVLDSMNQFVDTFKLKNDKTSAFSRIVESIPPDRTFSVSSISKASMTSHPMSQKALSRLRSAGLVRRYSNGMLKIEHGYTTERAMQLLAPSLATYQPAATVDNGTKASMPNYVLDVIVKWHNDSVELQKLKGKLSATRLHIDSILP